MGSMKAMEMATAWMDGDLKLEHALEYHLSCNHYPPVHRAFIPSCIEAIGNAENDDWNV